MGSRVFTKQINSQLVISSTSSVSQLSIQVVSGTCTVQGNFQLNELLSGPITLSAGQGLVITGAIGNPIDGVTITPTGNTNILASFS